MDRDLTILPQDVQAAARVEENGEVSWPDSHAAAAINALADALAVVLGLDVRFYDSDGRFYEIAWSDFSPDASDTTKVNADNARLAALARLAQIDDLEGPEQSVTVERRVMVAWQ